MPTVIDGDLRVRGVITADGNQPSTGTVGDNEVTSTDPITTDKLFHRNNAIYRQKHGSATVTERMPIYLPEKSGNCRDFRVSVSVACIGDSTITAMLKKNGVDVLNTVVTLDSGNAAFDVEQGSFSSDAYAADDVFEVVITATVGTGTLGQGLICSLTVDEQPAV